HKAGTTGGSPVTKGDFEPGCRCGENVKPNAGADSCQAPHLLYCTAGRMKVTMDDGSDTEIGPGDVATIAPGHDAWIVGDEACEMIDFGGFTQYAKRCD